MSFYSNIRTTERSFTDVKEDPLGIQEFQNVWRMLLKQGLSVGAFVEDPKGGKSEIAGTNIIGYEIKDDDGKLDNYEVPK